MLLVQKDPPVRVPRVANRGGGRGPGAPDPVSDPNPVAERRTTRHSERQARVTQEQPPSVSGADPPAAVESEEEDEAKRKVRKDALPEDDYLVKWSAVEDKVRYIRWGPISTEHLRKAIASIADWMIRESGLDRAFQKCIT
ncbi:hypothetical protein R1sor_019213 [Riccia sorocarpa]|uniref:Uncharacterized protein n=1 Tax=Riccia sorocarpa TaxID=122646 RepID=A0ABD3ID01_9MARC